MPNNLPKLFQLSPARKIAKDNSALDINKLSLSIAKYLKKNQEKDSIQKQLERHIGADNGSTKLLKESLLLIQNCLENPNIPEDRKASIAAYIAESIDECTPGFQIRVDSIVFSLTDPESLEELLTLMRQDIVRNASYEILPQVRDILQVHANNDFFKIASEKGYGVHIPFPDDPYSAQLYNSRVASILKKAFAKQYNLFSILSNLEQRLRSVLVTYGYNGAKNEYDKTCSLLRRKPPFSDVDIATLPVGTDRAFLLIGNNEAEFEQFLYINKETNTSILINTSEKQRLNIQRYLGKQGTFNEEGVFYKKNSSTELQDKEFIMEILQLTKTTDMHQYNLGTTDKCSAFLKKMIPDLNDKPDLDNLDSETANVNQQEIVTTHTVPTSRGLMVRPEQLQEIFIRDKLFQVLDINWPYLRQKLYEILTSEYFELSAAEKKIIDCFCTNNDETNFRQEFDQLAKETKGINKLISNLGIDAFRYFSAWSLEKKMVWIEVCCKSLPDLVAKIDAINAIEDDDLQLACINNENIVDVSEKDLLDAIGKLEYKTISFMMKNYFHRLDDKDAIKRILLKRGSANNVLMLAPKAFPNEVPTILTKMEMLNDPEINVKIFLQTNSNNYNALMAAAVYSPSATSAMLEMIKKLNAPKLMPKIFLQKSNKGYNALMLVATHASSQSMPLLLDAIETLNEQAQAKIFLQTRQDGCDALKLTAKYSPNNLSALVSRIAKLNPNNQAEILLRTSTKGYNALMFAAIYSPSSVPAMLDIMQKIDQKKTILGFMMFVASRNSMYDVMRNLIMGSYFENKQAKILCQKSKKNGANVLMLFTMKDDTSRDAFKKTLEHITTQFQRKDLEAMIETMKKNNIFIKNRESSNVIEQTLQAMHNMPISLSDLKKIIDSYDRKNRFSRLSLRSNSTEDELAGLRRLYKLTKARGGNSATVEQLKKELENLVTDNPIINKLKTDVGLEPSMPQSNINPREKLDAASSAPIIQSKI